MSDLRGLKVGDPVMIVTSGYYGNHSIKRVVEKVTKTQVVIDDGSRWLMRGRKVGAGNWSREWLAPFDAAEHAENLRAAKERSLRNQVRDAIQRADLTLEQWERIDAILSEVTS